MHDDGAADVHDFSSRVADPVQLAQRIAQGHEPSGPEFMATKRHRLADSKLSEHWSRRVSGSCSETETALASRRVLAGELLSENFLLNQWETLQDRFADDQSDVGLIGFNKPFDPVVVRFLDCG